MCRPLKQCASPAGAAYILILPYTREQRKGIDYIDFVLAFPYISVIYSDSYLFTRI